MWCRFDDNEWLCNIRCVVLNYYDLGLLQVGLKFFVISIDYRDYMGSSLETWLLVDRFYTWTLIIWSVLWHLNPTGPTPSQCQARLRATIKAQWTIIQFLILFLIILILWTMKNNDEHIKTIAQELRTSSYTMNMIRTQSYSSSYA